MRFMVSIKRGQTGEEIVETLLRSMDSVSEVINVSEDKDWQKVDVDFLAKLKNGKTMKVEVKTDYLAYKTGNITWETSTSGNVGCCEKSPCDRFFWCITNENGKITRVFSIDAKAMKKKIEQYRRYFNEIRMGDNARGYLLKLEMVRNWGVVRCEWRV